MYSLSLAYCDDNDEHHEESRQFGTTTEALAGMAELFGYLHRKLTTGKIQAVLGITIRIEPV